MLHASLPCSPSTATPWVVLDLGANRGQFANYFANTYCAEVHAVEPNPDLYSYLVSLPAKVTFYQYAVSDNDGLTSFYTSPCNEAGSLRPEVAGAFGRGVKIEVEAITLEHLVSKIGKTRIDILKVDIEGAEHRMFDAASDACLQAFSQITVEFHDFLTHSEADRMAVRDIIQRLECLKFDCYRMTAPSNFDVLFINRKAMKLSFKQRASLWLIRRIFLTLKKANTTVRDAFSKVV